MSVDDLALSKAAAGEETELRDASALCLSGGGYRAMLFHAGALVRLGETGRLGDLDRISSVSGGSIVAGVLALAWPKLQAAGFGAAAVREHVVEPVRGQAGRMLDYNNIAFGLLPGTTTAKRVARGYRELFGDATLQDLPDSPRFVFNATNLQSAALWRFSKPYAQDHRVGRLDAPTLALTTVVGASSAFPPVLSPVRLRFGRGELAAAPGADLHEAPYTTHPTLTDGGVYDNLGLETAWKSHRTVFVSDGGGKTSAQGRVRSLYPLQLYRVMTIMDDQVRSLRKRALVEAYRQGLREGAYWGIRTDIANYGLANALVCPREQTERLAATPTRLAPTADRLQERLINWGYAVCDAALRTHVDPSLPAPAGFVYPEAGVR